MAVQNTNIILVKEEPRGPSQLLEIPITANGQNRIPLPEMDDLKNDTDQVIVIKALTLVTPDVLVGPVIQSAGPNAPLAELQKMTLVLYSEGYEKGQYIPLLQMNDEATPAGTFPYRFNKTRFADWKNVSWTKSYLQLANNQVTAGAPYTVLLDCEFQRFYKDGVTEKKGGA
jgi:hypothetical protein